MKKNLFLKLLAMTLAAMLVIGCVGAGALADDVQATADNTPVNVAGDVEGHASAYAESGQTVELTITGDVSADDGFGPALWAEAVDGGTATVKAGDVENVDSDVVNLRAVEGGKINATTGDVTLTSEDEGYIGLHAMTEGADNQITVTTGDITSDFHGVQIENGGGTINATTGSVSAEEYVAVGVNAPEVHMVNQDITEQAFFALDLGDPVFSSGDQEYGCLVYRVGDIDYYDNYYTEDNQTIHSYSKSIPVPSEAGSTTLTVNGNINITNEGNEAVGVSIVNENAKQESKVNVNGNITVKGTDVYEAEGVTIFAYGGTATADVTGKISVSGAGDYSYSTYGVKLDSYEESTVQATVTGNIDVQNKDADANGISVFAGEKGETEATVTGNVTVEGKNWAAGIKTEADKGGDAESSVTGDITVNAGSAYGIELQMGTENKGNITVDVDGDINVNGSMDAIGINSYENQGDIKVSVTGDINAKGTELAKGIKAENFGGTIDIEVGNDITSSGDGIVVTDGKYNDWLDYEDYPTFNKDEFLYTEYGGNGTSDLYCHVEGDQKIYYYATPNGEIYWAFMKKTHDPGTTSVAVGGDVTATDAGVYVTLDNEKSKMDVIVEGTLSGKTQSVLVSEDTISDNLTLTVWEVKPNEAGNLAERVTGYDEKGKETTVADQELEKKIQYIIKVEPTQTDYITTQGTTAYEGYNVAHEGETVTLKLNIPAGYKVTDAFNGTDTKVKLAQDASGNYYLIVPRGGAVMLSVALEKLPDPQPVPTKKTTTTEKVAVMKPAEETEETKAFKDLIESGDIMEILPEEIKEQLPEGISKVEEAVTLTLENYEDSMGAVTLKVAVKKTYTKGEKATVVIALPDGKGGYTYFYIEGEGEEDGTLSLNIPAATAKALAGKTFVTMILE